MNIENITNTIVKVKLQEDGYLVTSQEGTFSVPNDENNRHYKEVQEYLKDNKAEPEFTKEELKIQKQNKINSDAKAYLKSTDWYVIRKQETDQEIPEEILTKRQEARDSII